MSNIKSQYENIVTEKNKIIEELNRLEKDEIVKKYLELSMKSNVLGSEAKKLYTQMKNDEFLSCKHIWITTKILRNRVEGGLERYEGCIKCGLDQTAFIKDNVAFGVDFASVDERLMINFMKTYKYRNGLHSNAYCDLSLAKAIYKKIKENHPDIGDETARKYFEIALNNMKNTKVSEDRKVKRAKRLSLTENFKG